MFIICLWDYSVLVCFECAEEKKATSTTTHHTLINFILLNYLWKIIHSTRSNKRAQGSKNGEIERNRRNTRWREKSRVKWNNSNESTSTEQQKKNPHTHERTIYRMYVTYFLINSVLNVQECTKYAEGEKTVAKTTLLLFFRLFFLFGSKLVCLLFSCCVCVRVWVSCFGGVKKNTEYVKFVALYRFQLHTHTLTRIWYTEPSASDVSNEKKRRLFSPHSHT